MVVVPSLVLSVSMVRQARPPPFSVFQEGKKIAEGFGSIEDAEEWIDTNIIGPPAPEEDEDEGPSSPRPF